MREIKYKAYLKEHGFIVDVEGIDFDNKIIYHDNIQTNSMIDTAPERLVNPICYSLFKDIELMQYTGLKDKNGKEIYEGDIVSILSGSERINSRINFENACFNVVDNNEVEEFFKVIPLDKSFDMEIIGNIYENPELLEKEQ